ncbi:MAG: biopolymer transporter ExbD [Gammaproteobacteria bacterium]|nr:biopolymer transporter ExbD [Gammaproteobacteria bacterium]
MNLRRYRHEEPDLLIDIAPLIDVVFILLIFFMVSTTFSREAELEINLPEASPDKIREKQEIVDISIDTQGYYYVNGKALINDQFETLIRALKRETKANKKASVIINADVNTPYQSIIKVMDAAQQVGLARLSFATRQKQPDNKGE